MLSAAYSGIFQATGLENSVVVLAPLVPWSIAGTVPPDLKSAPNVVQ